MQEMYPLKFKTIYKEKLWGGQKIKTLLGKDFGALDNCGETWEISGVPGNISEVDNGPLQGVSLAQLVKQYKGAFVGQSIYEHFGDEFPLLVKFIDAAEDLSVQVHPDDELAMQKHGCKGKAEMWYILQSDPEAKLINGFNADIDQAIFLEKFTSGKILEILDLHEVAKGDVFYLPGGRIHSIGAGMLLAEIQQTSDITYRIYDFDRLDKEGNKRELHTEDGLEALDFMKPDQVKSSYDHKENVANSIVSTPFFSANKLQITETKTINRTNLDCFKIYMGVGGQGVIAGTSIQLGEVVLIPASIKTFSIEPEGPLELLETYIEL